MFSHFKINRLATSVVSLSYFLLLPLPSFGLSDGDLQRAILDAKALGDVGASVRTDGTTALVTTYLTARDDIKTCKAKGILVAKTLFDRVKTLALVRCTFCTPGANNRYIMVSVGEGTIKAFAAGNTTMPKLIASIPYEDTRNSGGALTSNAGASSLANPLNLRLNGAVHLKERQVQKSLIEALNAQGASVTAAAQEFNNEQTAIDNGDLRAYSDHFNKCTLLIEALNASANRRAQAASQQDGSPVVPGLLQGERTQLWNRLNELKRQGKYNPSLQQRFDAIEQLVPQTDKETLEIMIQSLFSRMK